MLRRVLIWIFILNCSLALVGQDNMGIANSNFAPTNTIFLNPSSSADSRAFIDFNLSGTSIFARNNYVFVNNNLLSLDSDSEPIFNDGNAPYKAFVDYQLHGPSLSFSYGKWGLGITSSLRSVTSAKGIPNHLANHASNGFDYTEQLGEEYTTSNARLGTLAWLEVGANVSYIIQQKGTDMLTVGATIKYLNAAAGGGLNIKKWNYQVENDSVLNSYEFIGEYGLSDINSDDSGTSNFLGNGSGIGLDLGFNYKKMKKSCQGYLPNTKGNCEPKEYEYKFGFSLIDIGRINLKEGFYREFDVEDSLVWEDYNGANIDDGQELDSLLSNELIGVNGSTLENSFKMLLPTALSLQFDYNIGKGFYANATLIHGFGRKRKLGVERANTLSFTPRYESRQVEVALPITVQNYEKMSIGAALRVYSVIIGTDNLGSLLGSDNTYGADFYFSLKYTMFRPWYCREQLKKSRSSSRRGRRGKANPCPSW